MVSFGVAPCALAPGYLKTPVGWYGQFVTGLQIVHQYMEKMYKYNAGIG